MMRRWTRRKVGEEATDFRIPMTVFRSDYERISRLAEEEECSVAEWLRRRATDAIWQAVERGEEE